MGQVYSRLDSLPAFTTEVSVAGSFSAPYYSSEDNVFMADPRRERPTRRNEFFTDQPQLVSSILGYRWSPFKTGLFLTFSILSLGLLPLLMFLIGRFTSAEIIKRTHLESKLDRATIFIVQTSYRSSPLISRPIVVFNEKHTKKALTFEAEDRIFMSFFRRIFSTLSTNRFTEFTNENDSASAFSVHTNPTDHIRAGVDAGRAGIYIWNKDKNVFQRASFGKSDPNIQSDPFDEEAEYLLTTAMDSDLSCQKVAVNDDHFNVELYRKSTKKTMLCYLFSFLTGGILSIIFIWKPSWRILAMFEKLNFGDSQKATHIKIWDANINDNVWIRPLWLSSRKGVLLREVKLTSKKSWQLIWRFFVFESMPFVLDPTTNRFVAGPVLYEQLIDSQRHLETSAVSQTKNNNAIMTPPILQSPWARRSLCGFNVTPVPLTPIWLIFWREFFTPLYLFQVACCVMWFLVDYTIYASCLITFAFFTIAWSVYMTYTNEHAVWEAVVGTTGNGGVKKKRRYSIRYHRQSEDDREKVLIAEHGDVECGFATSIVPKMLVPGDVVFLGKTPDGRMPQIPADLVLIEGSCLVDESMLSGEVTPVTKFACPNPSREKPMERNILHSGTKLVCISSGAATAMVITTGFCTTRGRLVRSVLRPTKADVRFTVETIKFLSVMAIVGLIGLTYTVVIRVLRDEDPILIMIMCGVLAAVVVPPQLSVGLTISLVVAQVRLKARKIFCTNPKSVTPTGSVDLVCFDKTGTLTEESVRLKSVLSIGYEDPPELQDIDKELVDRIAFYYHEGVSQTFELCAASCNTLAVLPASTAKEANDGDLEPIGDPIDLELYRFSQFKILPNGGFYSLKRPTLRVDILKNFGFSPERRSAAVVAKASDYLSNVKETIYVFVKGAPEHILERCSPSSIPKNTAELMSESTQSGLRLILLAAKEVDPDRVEEYLDPETSQDAVEKDVELIGISFFENCVKPESRPTIQQLQAAQLRSLIITGDDVRTAVATAREVGIVGKEVLMIQEGDGDHNAVSATNFVKMCAVMNLPSKLEETKPIAITEDSWRILQRQSVNHFAAQSALRVLLEKGAVFARFRPEQKAEVVSEYRNRFNFIVAMVGDGANDCCALKAADVGVALTEAEASVASAFTCKNRNVSPLIEILKEGRCSLISTFGLFGVMVSYSSVQFSSMCILYWIQSNFADLQFLYLDLFLLTTLSLVFPLVPAFHSALSRERPHRRLLCFGQVAPILVHNFINLLFQLLAFFYVHYQPWFLPYNIPQDQNVNREYNSFESYSVFSISIFQYVWSAIIFSKGAPFRSRFYQSRAFFAHLVVLIIANHCIVLYLPQTIREFFQVFPPPSIEYRFNLLLLAYMNLCCSFICVRGVEELNNCRIRRKEAKRTVEVDLPMNEITL